MQFGCAQVDLFCTHQIWLRISTWKKRFDFTEMFYRFSVLQKGKFHLFRKMELTNHKLRFSSHKHNMALNWQGELVSESVSEQLAQFTIQFCCSTIGIEGRSAPTRLCGGRPLETGLFCCCC